MPRISRQGVALLAAVAVFAAGPTSTRGAGPPPKVAIIVGPVGALTDTYRQLADLAADVAARHGAVVARAYSPAATSVAVTQAVEGASYVIYFGHGNGFPSPYAASPNPAHQNGWGLQGPAARGTDEDSWQNGTLAYLGEDWIRKNLHPAPGWVMIYSNACFAPGAGDAVAGPANLAQATARAAAYARAPLEMGARAYFATDFYAGAATLLDKLMAANAPSPEQIYLDEPNLVYGHVTSQTHPDLPGAALLLYQGPYLDGEVNYWYAYSGPNRIAEPRPPTAPTARTPRPVAGGLRDQTTLTPTTVGTLPPGPVVGRVLRADGSVAGKRRVQVSASTRVLIAGHASLGGEALTLLASGPLAGFWVAATSVPA